MLCDDGVTKADANPKKLATLTKWQAGIAVEPRAAVHHCTGLQAVAGRRFIGSSQPVNQSITIISGAQTGADIAALDAALSSGTPCGGWVPENRNNESGPIPPHYPVQPLPGAGYKQRMVRNITDTDATVIVYFSELEGGTENTLIHCLRLKKPYKLVDAAAIPSAQASSQIEAFVHKHHIHRLNIAGPRESKQPEAYGYTHEMVKALIERLRGRQT